MGTTTTQFMLSASDDSHTATMLPPRVFPYKNSSLKLAKFFFLFLISSSKRQHSFLKLAKDGSMPWYRYKLVKCNMAWSRELAFGTLLGNETTESGKTPCQTFPAWYQFQFSIDSAKLCGNQLPNSSLGIILAYSLVQRGYFSNLLKECLVHHRMCLHRKAQLAEGEKEPGGKQTHLFSWLGAIIPWRKPAGTSFQQHTEVPHSTSCSTGHCPPQGLSKTGKYRSWCLAFEWHHPQPPEMPSWLLRKSPAGRPACPTSL